MKRDTELTRVIFKVFSDGDVIACFPRQLGTQSAYTCGCYMHIGQHSTAQVWEVARLKAAKPEQYAALARELENIGYRLDIRRKFTQADQKDREAQLNKSE